MSVSSGSGSFEISGEPIACFGATLLGIMQVDGGYEYLRYWEDLANDIGEWMQRRARYADGLLPALELRITVEASPEDKGGNG